MAHGKVLILLFLGGILLRAGIVFFTGSYASPRLWEFDLVASNIVEGHGYLYSMSGLEYRGLGFPLYMYLTAGVYFVFGEYRYVVMLALQSLFTLALGLVVYELGKYFSARVGFIAMGLAITHPGLLYYVGDSYDMIFSYRTGRDDSIYRKLASRVWFAWLQLLFSITVPQFSSLFLFRREAIQQLNVRVSDRTSNMLPVLYIQAHQQGLRVGLVGTYQPARAGGRSKGGNFLNALFTVAEDLALWWRWRVLQRSPCSS